MFLKRSEAQHKLCPTRSRGGHDKMCVSDACMGWRVLRGITRDPNDGDIFGYCADLMHAPTELPVKPDGYDGGFDE